MTLDQRLLRATTRRIVPFLILCYFCAYLDRINVGVAALQMNRDLGLSAAAFGLGAGLFFLTYFLFEVPSNLLMQRVGARRWIARIMLSWGIVSAAGAFVHDATGFYVVRLLLGAAEAGFFPAVLLYLNQWFPKAHRARVFSLFLVALPIAGIVGTPLSGALMLLDGAWGFRGWQWLFVLEALPAILLAPVALRFLTDRPDEATWLSDEERARLDELLADDLPGNVERARPWSALRDWRISALSLVHLCGNLAIYGLAFFLPQIVATIAKGAVTTSVLAAVPYLAGAAGMLWFGRRASRPGGGSRLAAALPFAVAAAGFLVAALGTEPYVWLPAVCVAAFGCFGYAPGFWVRPGSMLSGPALAVAIAVVNSIGNLGGFVGPYSIGALKDATGGFTAGLWVSAAIMAGSAVLIAVTVGWAGRGAATGVPDGVVNGGAA